MPKMQKKTPLPIDPYLPGIVKDCLEYSDLLLKASPGSGKTTRLPWAIASASSKKVIVLEPRRIAAKLAAQRIADENELRLGEDVGYHFRFEKKTTPETKLIFYTEGTFLRLLSSDPELRDVGVVILDEFHERHLETDVALAYLRSLQKRRSDFKIILMSATLDTDVMNAFPNAKTIEIEAQRFEIKLHYLPNQPSILNQSLEQKVKFALETLPLEGDALIFLPGMREMMKVQDYLGSRFGEVHLLHSEISKEEQDLAITPHSKRKIILSTNIAESSITIPGIKIVIDSGIQREAHYSPWNGLKLIEDRPITKSSAIQRAGRAGRTSNGDCFRLYSEMDFNERAPYTIPEILKADLTDTFLLSLELNGNLNWFTTPPADRWKKAQELTYQMGAITSEGKLTKVGEEILKFPTDSRISRTLLAAKNLEAIQKKKLLRFICEEIENDRSGLLMNRLRTYLKDEGSEQSWEKPLLFGFIDQVAKFRTKQRDFIHYSGKTLKVHHSLKDLHDGYYLVLDITKAQEAILVVPIEEEWLYEIEPFPFKDDFQIEITQSFQFKSLTKLGSIVIDETSQLPAMTEENIQKITIAGKTPFKKKWEAWKESTTYLRFDFWARHTKTSLDDIESHLSLGDYINEYQTLNWDYIEEYFKTVLEQKLNIQDIEVDLPLKMNLGGRRELTIHYPFSLDPFLEAPIQDFYGLKETPTICRGKIPLALKLLGPHKRPLQVTKDIKGFWGKTYNEMKKELQREYPRHYWPDKPEEAKPFLLKSHLPK